MSETLDALNSTPPSKSGTPRVTGSSRREHCFLPNQCGKIVWAPASLYGGRHLVYLGNYHPMDHPLFGRDIESVKAEFLPALGKVVPGFDPSWVRESWMFGAPYAQPIVTREYASHIPPRRGPLQGLWVGSMFQVYPQDRGQNYSVALANRLAVEMATDVPGSGA